MNNQRKLLAQLLATTICLLTAGAAACCKAGTPPESFVLIRSTSGNETIQRCTVVAEKNGYALSMSENTRVWLPQERVLCIGKSMEEIYQFRKQRVSKWSSGDHIQMGRWCLRFDLVDQAADHYLSIPGHLRSHPSVAQFGQSIKAKMLEHEAFCQFTGLPPTRKATQLASSSTSTPDPGSNSPAQVVTASAQSQLGLTTEAKTRFFVKIQPILKNRCSQAACHGFRGKSDFRLYEPYGQAFSRIAEANLVAAAAHASVRPGSRTPTLVEYATSAHGVQRSPSVAPDEAVLIGELQHWCSLVSSPVVSALASDFGNAEGAVTAGGPHALSPSGLQPIGPGQSALRAVPQGSLPTPGTVPAPSGAATHGFPAGTEPPEMSEIDQLDQQLQQILNESKQPTASRPQPNSPPNDPFDASAFNNMPRK